MEKKIWWGKSCHWNSRGPGSRSWCYAPPKQKAKKERTTNTTRAPAGTASSGVSAVSILFKLAKISSPEERARMREYYRKNKTQLKRKAKLRKVRQQSGAQLKRKRMGTAASGYTFVQDPNAQQKSSGPKPTRISSSGLGRNDFTVRSSGDSTKKTKLRGL